MAITQNSIGLSWSPGTDNVRVAGYKIFNSNTDSLIVDAGNVLQYIVTGLNSNTVYGFYIKAYDDAGNESEQSNFVSAKTLN